VFILGNVGLGDNLIPARVKTDAQAININLMRTVQGIGQANRKQISSDLFHHGCSYSEEKNIPPLYIYG
jgi:hypothetical protein